MRNSALLGLACFGVLTICSLMAAGLAGTLPELSGRSGQAGASDGTRTHNPRDHNPVLSPIELRPPQGGARAVWQKTRQVRPAMGSVVADGDGGRQAPLPRLPRQ